MGRDRWWALVDWVHLAFLATIWIISCVALARRRLLASKLAARAATLGLSTWPLGSHKGKCKREDLEARTLHAFYELWNNAVRWSLLIQAFIGNSWVLKLGNSDARGWRISCQVLVRLSMADSSNELIDTDSDLSCFTVKILYSFSVSYRLQEVTLIRIFTWIMRCLFDLCCPWINSSSNLPVKIHWETLRNITGAAITFIMLSQSSSEAWSKVLLIPSEFSIHFVPFKWDLLCLYVSFCSYLHRHYINWAASFVSTCHHQVWNGKTKLYFDVFPDSWVTRNI